MGAGSAQTLLRTEHEELIGANKRLDFLRRQRNGPQPQEVPGKQKTPSASKAVEKLEPPALLAGM